MKKINNLYDLKVYRLFRLLEINCPALNMLLIKIANKKQGIL